MVDFPAIVMLGTSGVGYYIFLGDHSPKPSLAPASRKSHGILWGNLKALESLENPPILGDKNIFFRVGRGFIQLV